MAEKLRTDATIECLLLDFDSRLGQFFIEGKSHEWCWYNMFNHHFFGVDKSRHVTSQVLLLGARNFEIKFVPIRLGTIQS